MSSGALSEIRSGRRGLSPSAALKLLQVLPIEKDHKRRLVEAIRAEGKKVRRLLPEETQTLMRNWYYPAILVLFDLDEPPSEAKQIAERLNLNGDICRNALDNMVRFGLLIRSEKGTYHAPETSWTMGDAGGSETVKVFHRDGMELSLKALELVPVDKRDFSALTISGNHRTLEKVHAEIRRLHHRVSKLVGRGPRDRVFRMNVQFFSLDDWSRD